MEYFYIYKITCLKGSLKDHYYIGQHKTTNLDDGYKGSGRVIKDYYKKHPNDYIKEILCWCESEEDMNLKEDFYVGDLYDTDPLCLNLRAGGNQPGISEETRRKSSETMKGKMAGEKHPMYGHHHKEETRTKISEKLKGKFVGENNPMYGKGYLLKGEKNGMYGTHRKFSEEIRQKMSENHADNSGDKNYAYGTHWYTNGVENIRAVECPDGFHKGRTAKKCSIKFAWVYNNKENLRVPLNEIDIYLKNGYKHGRKI